MRLPFLSEEDPIQISLDTEGLNPNGGTYQAKITDAESTASLSANVPHNLHDKVVVHLTVDGYPRAFTYTVPLDRDYPSIDRERSLCNVQILSPRQNTIYQSPYQEPVVVEFRVDAPEDAFEKPGDSVQLKILEQDRTDREIQKKSFAGDRQVAIEWVHVKPQGEVTLKTRVGDFRVPMDVEGICDIHANFSVQLNLPEQQTLQNLPTSKKQDDVTVMFDGMPPQLGDLNAPSEPVFEGDDLKAWISSVKDNLSGIDKIEYGFALKNPNKLEASEVLGKVSEPNKYDDWELVIPAKELKLGSYTLLARATDRAGNVSDYASTKVTIVAPPPGGTDSKKTSDIVGQVFLEGGPLAGATVSLEGTSFVATTDGSGGFAFQNVPHGTYKIIAEGTAAGKTVTNTPPLNEKIPPPPPQTITLPAAKEPAEVTIKLRW
jgi:hypothetical protein